MSFYSHRSLNALLEASVIQARAEGRPCTYQSLALAAGIQKSYLSKVLHGRAQISGDQLYSIAAYLGWEGEERDFAFLLLEHERTGLEVRRKELAVTLEALRSKNLQTDSHIQAAAPILKEDSIQEFYLQPWLQLVHVALSVPRLAESLPLLGSALGMTTAMARSAAEALGRLGLAERRERHWVAKESHFHLSAKSPFFFAWRNQTRLHSLQRLQMSPRPKDYSFSLTFSADESTRDWLRAEFLALLARAEPKVRKAASQEVFQMNFDLFGWSERG